MAACLATLAVAGEQETLRIAEHDWPPFLFSSTTSQHKGIIKELLELCLPATGYRHEYRYYPINRVFAYLEDGKLDLNVMSRSPEREGIVRYGQEPLFTSSYRPVVLSEREITIRGPGDLDPLRLGHLTGLRYSPEFLAYVERRLAAGTAVTATSQEALLRMLLGHHIDIFVIPRESLVWRVREMGVGDQVKVIPYDVRTSDYFLAVSRRSDRFADPQPFLDAVDSCLRSAKRDGRHAAILAKYGIE